MGERRKHQSRRGRARSREGPLMGLRRKTSQHPLLSGKVVAGGIQLQVGVTLPALPPRKIWTTM